MSTLAKLGLRPPGPEQGFRHVRSPEWPGLVLILPAKGRMMRYRDWGAKTLSFRSLVIRDERNHERCEIVSSGFPKFFNWGEALEETEQMAAAMASGRSVRFTEKMDGSLVIRSVVDGRVMWRTRGQLGMGDHALALEPLLDAYPLLSDPGFRPTISLLFELTSPKFRIVLPYERDGLTLIGAISHRTLTQLAFEDLERLASETGVPLVRSHELPREHTALVAEVASWSGSEGIVASLEEGRILLKLKADEYLSRHRLRFALTARAIRQTCVEREVRSIADFEEYLTESGGDWELATDARPLVEAFLAAREQTMTALEELASEVEAKRAEFPERRDFAVEYATKLPKAQRPAAFLLADGKRDQAEQTLLNAELDRAFTEVEEREEALFAAGG